MKTSQTRSPTKLTPRTWFVLTILATTGQIAWAVENSWFNPFVFDTLTPDPRPVAWMVGVSAITATLTTIFMGTLSDRTRAKLGRRKPYILFGYILWGVATALFPTVAFIKVTSVAVVMVVLADAVMTFFGSTANDAAFNAWTTDITDTSNRGRVESVLQIAVFIANIITFVVAGMIIDTFGYFIFFYALGAIVIVSGIVAGGMLREPEIPIEDLNAERPPYLQELVSAFRWDTVRENPILFLLLLNIMIFSIGMQISFPFLLIYFENTLGFSKTDFGFLAGGVLAFNVILAIPFGLLADRWDRRKLLILASIVAAGGVFVFGFMRTLPQLIALGIIYQPAEMVVAIASMAWLKDLLPEDKRGQFLGIRMIFWIAIPMVVGPAIGSQLVQLYGTPITLNGETGFTPSSILWQVNGVVGLLSIIPLFFFNQIRLKYD
jgi:MFS family permease